MLVGQFTSILALTFFAPANSTLPVPYPVAPFAQLVSTRYPNPTLSRNHAPDFTVPTATAAITHSGEIWKMENGAALRGKGKVWQKLDLPRTYKIYQPAPHSDTIIRQVLGDADGNVWLATSQGAYITDGGNWWHTLNRADGVPYEDMTCMAMGKNGDVWGGTTQGAWRLRNGQFAYFWGNRWMPGNHVIAITIGKDNSVWIRTDKGDAHIQERKMTLAAKAAHYEEITQKRHNRRGWITGCGLKSTGDPDKGFLPEASDNDGLWTALYVCGEAFRYSVTKDPQARTYAKQSMEALLDLVRLSGYPGFPARAIIKKGEVVSGYNPDETVRVVGEKDKIWYASPTHPDLLIKGDCSSDELDGHYMAWMVYFDLVADEKEKAEIAKVCRSVTSNLLDHGFTLVGHTGRKTLYGVFAPQYMNDDPRWWEERGLNSIEMLCYLKVAEHICTDKRFTVAYNELINKHHYLINTLNYRRNQTWHQINHSDDELAYCVYYPLIRLETDPARRAILLRSLALTWNGGPVTVGLKEERGPFYSFIYGALSGEPCRTEDSIETLQQWPWELINFDVRNSHRHDITFRVAMGEGKREIDRVLPQLERRVMRWNGSPWEPDEGGAGLSEEDGTAYLLPYWLARYHKIIQE